MAMHWRNSTADLELPVQKAFVLFLTSWLPVLWVLEVVTEGLGFADSCQNIAILIWSCLVM